MATMAEWLAAIGLERYAEAFADAEIDVDTLALLTEDDLRELGLPLGPRRRILAAIAAPASVKPASPAPVAREPAAERRHVTVMFVDLVGSTTLSTRMDPEELGDLLARYKALVAEEIVHAGGTVAKYLGDGVLAYFGWPLAREHAPEDAARCGLQLAARVQELTDPQGQPLQARVGIATGLVVVGGAADTRIAREDMIAGEVLNLAARLQAEAQPGEVVVSDATRALIVQLFEAEDMGALPLKGFDVPVRAWRLLGAASHTSRMAARTTRTAFVGRETELAMLVERWEEASSGEGRTIVILGEAGMGKSRLAAALLAHVRDMPHSSIVWQCSAFHSSNALYPVIDYLTATAEIGPDDPPGERLDKLRGLLDTAEMELQSALPLFAELLSIAPEAGYVASDLPLNQRRAATIAALADWVRHIAENKPLLLLLEDAHWADPTTLEFITRLINTVGTMPALAVVTGRPEFNAPWIGRSKVSVIGLDRLTNQQCEELVRKLAEAEFQSATVREIVARSDGNPLYLEELSVAVLEQRSAAERAVPHSLQSSLMARLDQLAEAKETAQICSVLGRRFARPLLVQVCGMSVAELDMNLSLLVSHNVLHPIGRAAEGRYEFKHALLRDAAYESLLLAERRRLHAACGTRLEADFEETVRTEPELLGYHFSVAGQPAKASLYYERAGDRARDGYSFSEAITSYRDALRENDLLPDGEARDRRSLALLLKLGPALALIDGAQVESTAEVYRLADGLARAVDDPDALFQAVWGRWYNANVGRDFERAAHFAQDLIAIGERTGDEDHVLESLHCRWSSGLFRGECIQATDDALRGRMLYRRDRHHQLGLIFGGHDPGVCAAGVAGSVLAMRGRFSEATDEILASLVLAESLEHPHSIAHALMNCVTVNALSLDVAALRTSAARLLDLAERMNFGPHRAMSLFWLRWADARGGHGDHDALIRTCEAGMASAPLGPVYAAHCAAELVEGGRPQDALVLLDRAISGMRTPNVGLLLPELCRMRGEALAAMGDMDAARAEIARAIALAAEQGADLLLLRAERSAIGLQRRLGREAPTAPLVAILSRIASADADRPDYVAARALLTG